MTRALVLSGGGSVGIAWQAGLMAGLAEAGIRLADADLIVGTSAGSAVGAQLALGRDLSEQVERSRAAAAEAVAGGGGPASDLSGMAPVLEIMAEPPSPTDPDGDARRARIGATALAASTMSEDDFVARFAYLDATGLDTTRRDGEPSWPRRFACTTVDAQSGTFIVWDAGNPAPLARAVASSCSVPGIFPPITIDGRRYIDGGMRSATNADLAEDHDRVLIVSLMPAPAVAVAGDPMARYTSAVLGEIAVIAEAGGQVEVVTPDDATSAAIGLNLMDQTLAGTAADEGIRQGRALADTLADFWV